MNAALKSELEMQAAMHATDVAYEHKGGDLMARELEADAGAQLAVVSEGFQLLKNERHEATTVLRAQATVRAALDEERAAVARMRRSLSEKRRIRRRIPETPETPETPAPVARRPPPPPTTSRRCARRSPRPTSASRRCV